MDSHSNITNTTRNMAHCSNQSTEDSSKSQPAPKKTEASTQPLWKRLAKRKKSPRRPEEPKSSEEPELNISLPDYESVVEDLVPKEPAAPEFFQKLAKSDKNALSSGTFFPGLAFFVVERSEMTLPCFLKTRRRAAKFKQHYGKKKKLQKSAIEIMVKETEKDGPSSLAQFVVLDTQLLSAMARACVLQAKSPDADFVLGIVNLAQIKFQTYISMRAMRKKFKLSIPVLKDTRILVWSHLPNMAIKYVMPWKKYSDMLIRERIFGPLVLDGDVDLHYMNGTSLLGKWMLARWKNSSKYDQSPTPATLFLALWEYMGLHPQEQMTKQLVCYLLMMSDPTRVQAKVDQELNKMLMMDRVIQIVNTGHCAPRTAEGASMLTPVERFHMAQFRYLCSMFRSTKGSRKLGVVKRHKNRIVEEPTKLDIVVEEDEPETGSGVRNSEGEPLMTDVSEQNAVEGAIQEVIRDSVHAADREAPKLD